MKAMFTRALYAVIVLILLAFIVPQAILVAGIPVTTPAMVLMRMLCIAIAVCYIVFG